MSTSTKATTETKIEDPLPPQRGPFYVFMANNDNQTSKLVKYMSEEELRRAGLKEVEEAVSVALQDKDRDPFMQYGYSEYAKDTDQKLLKDGMMMNLEEFIKKVIERTNDWMYGGDQWKSVIEGGSALTET